jgi:hypothetical protein
MKPLTVPVHSVYAAVVALVTAVLSELLSC